MPAEAEGVDEPGHLRASLDDEVEIGGEIVDRGVTAHRLRVGEPGEAARRRLRGPRHAVRVHPLGERVGIDRRADPGAIAGADQDEAAGLGPVVRAVHHVHQDGARGGRVGAGSQDHELLAARHDRQVHADRAGERGAPGPGRVDHGRRRDVAARGADPRDTSRGDLEAGDRRVLADLHPQLARAGRVGLADARGVAVAGVGLPGRAAEAVDREAGHHAREIARADLLDLDPEAQHHRHRLAHGRHVFRPDRHHEPAAGDLGRAAGQLLEVAVRLEGAGRHPGVELDRVVAAQERARPPGGAGGDVALLEQHDAAGAPAGELQRDGRAHHAASHDDDVSGRGGHRRSPVDREAPLGVRRRAVAD